MSGAMYLLKQIYRSEEDCGLRWNASSSGFYSHGTGRFLQMLSPLVTSSLKEQADCLLLHMLSTPLMFN